MMPPEASIHAGFSLIEYFRGPHPVGETKNQPFQLSFNSSLKVVYM
jgi:hypothetical protein